jgi:opacity protein-like surface antigen
MANNVTGNFKMHSKKSGTINGRHGLAAAGATLFIAASGHAESLANCPLDNIYAGVDAGGSFQQNISILNDSGFNGGGGEIKFQPGWRIGGFAGYRFCDHFSAEISSGVIWNNITTIGIQNLSGVASARLEEVPLIVSGIYTYPVGNFKPFVGAGIGAGFGFFDGENFQPLGGPTHYRSDDTTFLYQFEIGAGYSILKNLDLSVAYRFVGTGDHYWNNGGIPLTTSGTLDHTLEAQITWRF